VTSDHLDRHGSLAAYRAVKRRLAELVDRDGALVLNADDPTAAAYAGLGTAPAVMYRVERPMIGGVGIVADWIVADRVERLDLAGGGIAASGPGGRILPVAELPLPGRHNVSNALAAISVALLFGLAPDAIRAASATFRGVEHRLEPVGELGGADRIGAGEQQEELLATPATREVGVADGRAKDGGELAEDVVARRVAVDVVDRLEVVEVGEREGERRPEPVGAR